MALQLTHTDPDTTVQVLDAYRRIDAVYLDTRLQRGRVEIGVYVARPAVKRGKKPVDVLVVEGADVFDAVVMPSARNLRTRLYDLLKLRPEYAGALDVLEENLDPDVREALVGPVDAAVAEPVGKEPVADAPADPVDPGDVSLGVVS